MAISAKKTTINLVVFIMCCGLLGVKAEIEDGFVQVRIYNRGSRSMAEICKSNGIYLGQEYEIMPNSNYQEFLVNKVSTIVECVITKHGGTPFMKRFEAYNFARDNDACGSECDVVVYDANFCRINRRTQVDGCWNFY